jgi:hypothetical protein
VALLEKRRFLYNHSGDFPQVILIIPSHVPNNGCPGRIRLWFTDSYSFFKNKNQFSLQKNQSCQDGK